MNQVKTISFVGAGALASGLAKLLHAQGFRIAEIVTRPASGSRRKGGALARTVGASVATLANAKLRCDALWLAVPDAAIEDVAQTPRRARANCRRSSCTPAVP